MKTLNPQCLALVSLRCFLILSLSIVFPLQVRAAEGLNYPFFQQETFFTLPGSRFILRANLFGMPQRTVMPLKAKIARKVAKIINYRVGHCTASLIGPRLLLTAAHCLHHNGIVGGKEFLLGPDPLYYLERTRGLYYIFGGRNSNEDDWGLVITKKALGAKYGYFELADAQIGDRLIVPGFGMDELRLTYAHSCHMTDKNEPYDLLHDCDVVKGDSGSPVLNCSDEDNLSGCKLVGVASGERRSGNSSEWAAEYTRAKANSAVRADSFRANVEKWVHVPAEAYCQKAGKRSFKIVLAKNGKAFEGWGFQSKDDCYERLATTRADKLCMRSADGGYGIVDIKSGKFTSRRRYGKGRHVRNGDFQECLQHLKD